ncbi:unnamed protein product [Camellia sinensis]
MSGFARKTRERVLRLNLIVGLWRFPIWVEFPRLFENGESFRSQEQVNQLLLTYPIHLLPLSMITWDVGVSFQSQRARARGSIDLGKERAVCSRMRNGSSESTLLKKHSSSTYPSTEAGEGTKSEASLSKTQQKEPLLIETVLLVVFEKLFSFLLNLPDVNKAKVA